MKLPRPAKVVVASSFTTGAITFAAALVVLLRAPVPSTNNFVVFATLTTLVAATWIWPLVMYRGTQSELINLDEGFFVVAALLLPMSEAVLVFAVAIGVAHVVRRRPLAKVLFNWGQVVMSAGLGVAVAHVLAPATARLSGAEVAAATVGAVVFSVVNNCSIATIVASLGTSWWTAVRDGGEIRARLAGACIAVGVMTSLALSAYRWSWPLAVLPLLILRQVLAGHFQARHDRERLLGLFNAALDANRSLGEGEVAGAVLESARDLLRCPDATISVAAPGPEQLGAPMLVNGEPSWLVVSGRSPTEPFDAADGVLLEALGAVGAGALTNGQHYREGRFQRERLAAITSSLGEGVCALDKAARVTFMNPAARHMLGTWLDDLDATPDYLLAPALAVMLNRETLRVDDTDFRRLDGTILPVALTASVILDEDQVAGAVIAFRDISERREVETAIREARDQAIEASRHKSQFLANMSHEIRTPMNGVLCMSRLLLDTTLDEMQRECLQVILDSGENLMVIINDILDFSKIEAGKLELEEVDFDLPASLASVTNSLAVPAREKGLSLELDLAPSLPAVVRGDPVRLRQVLTNLVGNAIKFTPAGRVTITAAPMSGGRVRISVADTGIGIDPSARATVLGTFGQADSSTTRRYGGTGLGLAICNQLVAMMGGVLDFNSQPGQGSTFWFEVPFEAAAASVAVVVDVPASGVEVSSRAAVVQPEAVSVPVDEPVARVLLADDSAVNQLVASLELERLGYRVDVVTTGEDAIDAVDQTRYHAVLMDCLMPGIDGYEATRRIRRLEGPGRATPIIAMTASAILGDREECILAGMDGYLSKPLDSKLLAAALARTRQQIGV